MLKKLVASLFKGRDPKTLSKYATLLVTAFLLALLLWSPASLRRIEENSMDLFYTGSSRPGDNKDVVVVGLDRRTFAETKLNFSRFFPKYTEIIKRLSAAGTRAIAFDIGISAAPDNVQAARFVAAVEAAPPFILASQLPTGLG